MRTLTEGNSVILLTFLTNPDIRTYSVVPLNEEHGVVEWVPHTRVLRDIILRYLRQKGIQFNVQNFNLKLIFSTPKFVLC